MCDRPCRPRVALRLVPALLVAALAWPGCGASAPSGCVASTEAIDPRSTQHVLPGAPEPDYRTDPPTSGPHLMGRGITGVAPGPLPRPVQVGILERGAVILHHAADDETMAGALAPLGGQHVVVAPHPDLDGPVATAWGRRLRCPADASPAVVAETFAAFVEDHVGTGPHMGSG